MNHAEANSTSHIGLSPVAPTHWTTTSIGQGVRSHANRFALDYRTSAATFVANDPRSTLFPPTPSQPHNSPRPILDIHSHINGVHAIPIYRDVARAFGVTRVVSQVGLVDVPTVKAALGDFVRFIAFPTFRAKDRIHAMTQGFLDDIPAFRAHGAGFAKLWNAPRTREFFPGPEGSSMTQFDGEWRVRHARAAHAQGMGIMVHIADPDTWFASRYSNYEIYGRKIDHYRGLRTLLDLIPVPFIGAHMCGWPEDLDMLDTLLAAHPNLNIDTSATKWVVRALSTHPTSRVVDFFTRWRSRILFGSDLVTIDEHVLPSPPPTPVAPLPDNPTNVERAAHAAAVAAAKHPMADLADSPEAAFDLYASRYHTLRTLFETDYLGQSPIADPDLMMVDPTNFDDMSAPLLKGFALPPDILDDIYCNNAARLFASVGCPLT